jgi:hypothetical protein
VKIIEIDMDWPVIAVVVGLFLLWLFLGCMEWLV